MHPIHWNLRRCPACPRLRLRGPHWLLMLVIIGTRFAAGESPRAMREPPPSSPPSERNDEYPGRSAPAADSAPAGTRVRFATFNASLSRREPGRLIRELSTGDCTQARQAAQIVQRVRPDVLLINEMDYDSDGVAVQRFHDRYLGVSEGGQRPITYPYHYVGEVNTGVSSGVDLDKDGNVAGAADAFGFGFFPGQFGMVVFSRYPIDHSQVRTFRKFLWNDMPGAKWPKDPDTGESFYGTSARRMLRLSSKSHWDVPVVIHGQTVHLLACHPTPPVFDGPEDRNGHRNYDEIRLFADYVSPSRSGYIYDDRGHFGGLQPGDRFVIVGDLNADPFDGDSLEGAVKQLLTHPLIHGDRAPRSGGGSQQARRQGMANQHHRGDPANDTADFSDGGSGNLRVDYVLPSRTLRVVDGGVFWPSIGEAGHELVECSDHRLVWVDVQW